MLTNKITGRFAWVALLLMALPQIDAQACGARIKKVGEAINMEQFGLLISVSVGMPPTPMPKDYFYEITMTHSGRQDYIFYYSESVRKIRLWMGDKKVYEGPPIPKYTGTGRPPRIDVQADGDFSVRMDGGC